MLWLAGIFPTDIAASLSLLPWLVYACVCDLGDRSSEDDELVVLGGLLQQLAGPRAHGDVQDVQRPLRSDLDFEIVTMARLQTPRVTSVNLPS